MDGKRRGLVQPLNDPENNNICLEISELEARLEQQAALLQPGTEQEVCPYYFCSHKCDEKCMTILTE